jgi:glycosyltransferase involved in cell wall biosynthesis
MNESRPHMLTVLHCIPHLCGGGAERQLSYLAAEQVRRGHDVHVAYLNAGAQPTPMDSIGVTCHRIKAVGNYDLRILSQLYRLAGTLSPDIIQSWLLHMDVLTGLVCWATGIPWILREPTTAQSYSGWKARLRRLVGQHASAVVANSPAGAEYWRSVGRRGSVRVVRSAIPLERLQATPAEVFRTQAGEAPPFMLFAGRLEPEKNLETLLEALALFIKDTDLYAVWCGEGNLQLHLQRRAAELGIGDRVVFLGQQPAEMVWGLMKSAIAFTLISRYEGLPNVVLEAMASGCPLVLSDISSHRMLASDSEAEFVDVNDPESIARGIRRLLAEPVRARERVGRAWDRMKAWSVPQMADAYDELYWSVVAKHGV